MTNAETIREQWRAARAEARRLYKLAGNSTGKYRSAALAAGDKAAREANRLADAWVLASGKPYAFNSKGRPVLVSATAGEG